MPTSNTPSVAPLHGTLQTGCSINASATALPVPYICYPAVERQEDRFKVVLEAKDWRVVAAMFTEMGADIERWAGVLSLWLMLMLTEGLRPLKHGKNAHRDGS